MLTDCEMPGMTGYELARRIRADEAHGGAVRTPVIACTAHALVDEAQKCLAAGMDDCLVKPVDLASLRRTLARWLPATPVAAERAFELSVLGAVDQATEREILVSFTQACEQDMASLRHALAAREADLASHIAHRMLGACRMIGAQAMERLCLRIEGSSRADDWQDVAAALQGLDLAHHKLSSAIAQQKAGPVA